MFRGQIRKLYFSVTRKQSPQQTSCFFFCEQNHFKIRNKKQEKRRWTGPSAFSVHSFYFLRPRQNKNKKTRAFTKVRVNGFFSFWAKQKNEQTNKQRKKLLFFLTKKETCFFSFRDRQKEDKQIKFLLVGIDQQKQRKEKFQQLCFFAKQASFLTMFKNQAQLFLREK